MEPTILTWKASNGQQVEVRYVGGLYQVQSYLDGKLMGTGFTTFGRPKVIAGKSYVASIGKIALTREQHDSIRAAVKVIELSTPEGQMAALREERRRLVADIRAILHGTEVARERAFSEDLGRIPDYDSPEYRLAEARLAEFDAAHPEVLAAIKAEREAERKAHEWD